jgi:hypothetical protein
MQAVIVATGGFGDNPEWLKNIPATKGKDLFDEDSRTGWRYQDDRSGQAPKG